MEREREIWREREMVKDGERMEGEVVSEDRVGERERMSKNSVNSLV